MASEQSRSAGTDFARELVTWHLIDGEAAAAREAQNLVREPLLMVDTVMALTRALAATFGDIDTWREHIAKADLEATDE